MNYNILKIFIKNDVDRSITLIRKIKLDIFINYKIIKCFVINPSNYNLIIKILKRLSN